MYSDKNLTCADCGQEFVFTASEQDFYAQRGFTEPRRCPSCRASRKAARNAESGGSSYGGYGAGGGYSAGGSSYGGERWLRLPRSRPARDVHGHLLELRSRGPGPVPPDQRQARLLQRLLPEPARRLTGPSRCGPAHGPPNQPGYDDPGCQPTGVDRFRAVHIGRSSGRPIRALLVPPVAHARRGALAPLLARAFGSAVLTADSQPPSERLPAREPKSNLRSRPWISRSMLSAWASQMSAAPTAE